MVVRKAEEDHSLRAFHLICKRKNPSCCAGVVKLCGFDAAVLLAIHTDRCSPPLCRSYHLKKHEYLNYPLGSLMCGETFR